MLDENVFINILAGGSGTRFWPKSRHKSPKQLCAIGHSKTSMLEQTLERISEIVPVERRLVVTHHEQMFATQKIAGKLCGHFLAEPEAKNTAAALAMAALEIEKLAQNKNAIMISLHADAVITDQKEFIKQLTQAVEIAKKGFLTLLGIKPEYPETGYGYIEQGTQLKDFAGSFKVASFKEKPDLPTAKKYFESGRYLWNSGLFVFPVNLFLNELKKFHPEIATPLEELGAGQKSYSAVDWKHVSEVYGKLPKIAIDNAVLEKSNFVAVLPCSFGWKDVGSWDVLGDVFGVDENLNFIAKSGTGRVLMLDSNNSVVESDGPMIAVLGIDDMIVAHHKGAVLVCPKSRAQDVKLVVEKLKELEFLDLL